PRWRRGGRAGRGAAAARSEELELELERLERRGFIGSSTWALRRGRCGLAGGCGFGCRRIGGRLRRTIEDPAKRVHGVGDRVVVEERCADRLLDLCRRALGLLSWAGLRLRCRCLRGPPLPAEALAGRDGQRLAQAAPLRPQQVPLVGAVLDFAADPLPVLLERVVAL